jgi:hypothetical protein
MTCINPNNNLKKNISIIHESNHRGISDGPGRGMHPAAVLVFGILKKRSKSVAVLTRNQGIDDVAGVAID